MLPCACDSAIAMRRGDSLLKIGSAMQAPPRAGGGDDDDEQGSSDERWDQMLQDSMVMDGLAGGFADSGLGERDIALLQAIKAEDFPAD
jgi:hypothetical protein